MKASLIAAALAAGMALEPTQAPPLPQGDRRRSRLRFGAHSPAKRAAAKRIESYKRQRRADRLRRKALGK